METPRRRAPSPEPNLEPYTFWQPLVDFLFFQNTFSNHAQTFRGECYWLNKNQGSCSKEFRCTVGSGPHWSTRVKRNMFTFTDKSCIAVSSLCLLVCSTWLKVIVCVRCVTLSEDLKRKPTWIYFKHEQAENRWTMWDHLHQTFWKTHRKQAGRPLVLITS